MASQKVAHELAVSAERIESIIYLIRGQKVMLDSDLAELYGVETKALKRAVNRNRARFPEDFMFQLNNHEVTRLRCQNGTSKTGRGGSRYLPYAFTEQGVAMLSGVLTSSRAIKVNIEIMRAFVRLRKMLSSHAELARKLEELEKKYDSQFRVVFDAIRQLMAPREPEKKANQVSIEEETRQPEYSRYAVRAERAGRIK
jgi:phage regulator Rha-like protein